MMLGEQETIIRWDEEDKLIRWYSCSTVQLRRMEKMAARYPGQFRLVRRTDDSAWYEFAPGLLRIRGPLSAAAVAARARNSGLHPFSSTSSRDQTADDATGV